LLEKAPQRAASFASSSKRSIRRWSFFTIGFAVTFEPFPLSARVRRADVDVLPLADTPGGAVTGIEEEVSVSLSWNHLKVMAHILNEASR
jgi:hypothetical protein